MRRINLIALVVFVAILVWIFTLGGEALDRIQGSTVSVLSPFMRASTAVEGSIKEINTPQLSKSELLDHYTLLEKEAEKLRIENQQLERLAEENETFRKALRLQQTALFEAVSARIISRRTSTWFSTLIIDKGYDQEIAPDSPVLTDDGIVGKTTEVFRDRSVVILLTDEKCQVAAKVEGSREQGICMGQRGATERTPYLKLKFLSKQADLQAGTKVYSSGLGGVFPKNFLLGTVKEFAAGDLYGEASVEPAVDFSSLEHVFVIQMIQ